MFAASGGKFPAITLTIGALAITSIWAVLRGRPVGNSVRGQLMVADVARTLRLNLFDRD